MEQGDYTLLNKKFEEEIVNIYPPELTLKRTTESDTTLSYLDVLISIYMPGKIHNRGV